MSWVLTDETPTASVVWMAAEQIGKAQSHEQLQKICDYLVNKHWFQTAGDLRSARRETAEWQVLEVPGRLKLAIQQVLDQTAPRLESVPTYGYEDYYAAVRPSLTPGSESDAGTQQWTEDATGYGTAEGGDQVAADYYSGRYVYPSSEAVTDSGSVQYNYGQVEYSTFSTNPPSYDETYGVGYEGYYSSHYTDKASGFHDSGAAAATLLSLQGGGEQVGSQMDGSDVVEAHAVEAEVAEECGEGESVNDQPLKTDAIEHGEPFQTELSELSGNWTCGQCTFLNPMTSSFCEMCIGHISLSPDIKTTAGTSVSASLLIPAKPVVEVAANSPQVEPCIAPYSQPIQPSLTCMLPPVGSLYPPSAPDFDADIQQEDSTNSAPLPPPPPYPGTSNCGSVDFLALAFSGSTAPKRQATRPLPTPKSSQMRREEVTTFTEYTF